MLGVNRVGGIVSGASPAYNVQEMTYALKTANAKYLFTIPGSMEVASAAAKNAGIPMKRVFLLEGEIEGFTTMNELLHLGKKEGEMGQVEEYKLRNGEKNKDLCGFLSFSSGTTGLPKAVSALLLFPSFPKSENNTEIQLGHDFPPKRNCSMPPNPANHPKHPQKGPGCPPLLPHNRLSPRPSLANPSQRRSLHALLLHHGLNAQHHR